MEFGQGRPDRTASRIARYFESVVLRYARNSASRNARFRWMMIGAQPQICDAANPRDVTGVADTAAMMLCVSVGNAAYAKQAEAEAA